MDAALGTNHATSLLTVPERDPSPVPLRGIVMGTDFSGPSECALTYAAVLAKAFGAKLILVHAASPFICATSEGVVPYEILQQNIENIRVEIDCMIEGDPTLSSLAPTSVVAYGDPVDTVCEAALQHGADLIILGSSGASGLERLALGSVAERILSKATTPVMIVGPHCRPEGDLLRSIVVATDLKATGTRAVEYAAAVAEHSHGKLTALHVIQKRPAPDSEELARMYREAMHELAALLPQTSSADCTVSLKVEVGEIAQNIEVLALLESATLIVLGVRDHLGWQDHSPWSALAHIVREAHCPVLSVRSCAA